MSLEPAAKLVAGGRVVVAAGSELTLCAGLMPPEVRGGLWDELDVERCATPEALTEHPVEAYSAYAEYLHRGRTAAVSPAHRAIVELDAGDLLRGAIVTTTDGLLRRAGMQPRRVAETSGAIDRGRCTSCRDTRLLRPEETWIRGRDLATRPQCAACGSPLRPDMVLFGEALPRAPRRRAAQWIYGGRVLLCAGANLERPPLHRIADEMRQEGGRLIAFGEASLSVVRRVEGLHIAGDINDWLPRLVARALAAR